MENHIGQHSGAICSSADYEGGQIMQGEKMSWIPVEEKSPENDQYVLVSFENFTMPDIARYSEDDGGGTYYPGDDEKTYLQYGLFVNAWMPLPKPYREGEEG